MIAIQCTRATKGKIDPLCPFNPISTSSKDFAIIPIANGVWKKVFQIRLTHVLSKFMSTLQQSYLKSHLPRTRYQCNFIDLIHLLLMITSLVCLQIFQIRLMFFHTWKTIYEKRFTIKYTHGNIDQCIHDILCTRIEWIWKNKMHSSFFGVMESINNSYHSCLTRFIFTDRKCFI